LLPDTERVAAAVSVPNTALQPALRLVRWRFRQATIRSTFGISELHSRKTSPVQAWRCSGVPAAKLAVEIAANASAKMDARGDIKNLECFLTVKSSGCDLPRLASADPLLTLSDRIAAGVTPVTVSGPAAVTK
jgi:hypothetical protein